MFSVIIPVLHEGETINRQIAHLTELSVHENLEIIVVDGSDGGDTIAAIQDKDVMCLVSERGRAHQMNAGAAIARGEVLIFLHADTVLPASALSSITTVLRDQSYVGGAFDLGIGSPKLIFSIIGKMASIRSRITRIPYGDQGIFVRRGYFLAIGGYREIPLMEDVELMHRIKRSGDKICILSDKVITAPRRWEQEGIVFCTLRNWFITLLYCCGVSPRRLAGYYRAHGKLS